VLKHKVYISQQKKKGCFDSIWLPQFPTSSAYASLNTVETHYLLYIPTVIRVSRTLENIMGECFANEIVQWCGKAWNWCKQNGSKVLIYFLTVNVGYYWNVRFMQDAISSTLYVMVSSPTCPTWCNCSNHQVVKATTLVFAVQGVIAVIATQAMCNLS